MAKVPAKGSSTDNNRSEIVERVINQAINLFNEQIVVSDIATHNTEADYRKQQIQHIQNKIKNTQTSIEKYKQFITETERVIKHNTTNVLTPLFAKLEITHLRIKQLSNVSGRLLFMIENLSSPLSEESSLDYWQAEQARHETSISEANTANTLSEERIRVAKQLLSKNQHELGYLQLQYHLLTKQPSYTNTSLFNLFPAKPTMSSSEDQAITPPLPYDTTSLSFTTLSRT